MSLRAHFHVERGEFTLDCRLEVPAHGVTALFGASGCGKTTLLRAIAGLDRHPDGYLKIGEEIWQDGRHFVPPHRRALGYVFQEASLFSHLTVRGNLEYGLKRVPPGERRLPFDRIIDLLGLAPMLSRRPEGLSGGERQRVAVGRALLASPRLLLMDEPLAALDRASRNEILPFLRRLDEVLEVPVLYVSHSQDEVSRVADRLVFMRAGRIVAAGPISDMATRLDLPLAHGDLAEAVIEAEVAGHDDGFHLTYVDFPGGRFTVAREELPPGHRVRLRLLARDVSLTLERQTGTSILNVFPARVTELADESAAQVMVRLDAAGVPLLSRITRKSAAALGLAPGRELYAQVKSVALLT